jgi:hypothetical protein
VPISVDTRAKFDTLCNGRYPQFRPFVRTCCACPCGYHYRAHIDIAHSYCNRNVRSWFVIERSVAYTWLWSVIRWLVLFILCIRGLAIDLALCYHEVHTASPEFLNYYSVSCHSYSFFQWVCGIKACSFCLTSLTYDKLSSRTLPSSLSNNVRLQAIAFSLRALCLPNTRFCPAH